MKNKDCSKSSIKELKTVGKPPLEKLSLDELSYLAAGGNEALSRYEFAAGLNSCLNQIRF